jgi:FtsH-binding integral membrane protein
MATTERRLQEIRELETLWDISPERESKSPAPAKRRAVDLQPVLLGAWIVALATIFLFEPAPSNPNAVVPLWGQLLLTGFMAGFFATTYGLASRRSWGARASLVTAGFGVAIAVACAATEHHSGFWWGYEMASFSALSLLSLAALRRRSS